MAAAKKCDRCGRYYEDSHGHILVMMNKEPGTVFVDLCEDCKADMDAFLEDCKTHDYQLCVKGEKRE